MAKDPAFLFYSSDFLLGSAFLTLEECGQYIKALCWLHQHGGRLSKEKMEAVIGKMSDKLLEKFLIDKNGMLFNKRLLEELEKRNKYCESRRNNAKSYAKHMHKHMENENENINVNKDLKALDFTNNNIVNNSISIIKKKNKKTIPNTPHAQAIEYFCKKFEEKTGTKYVFNGGKDAALIKTMLGFLDLEQFKYKVNAFFYSGDEFVKKAGYTIGVFKSQINKIKGEKYETGIDRFIKVE